MDDQLTSGVETPTNTESAPAYATAGEAISAELNESQAASVGQEAAPQASQPTQVDQEAGQSTDNRDFRGYAKHLESEVKSLKQLIAEQKAKAPASAQSTPPQVATSVSTEEVDPQTQALAILEQSLERVVDKKLQPILSQYQEQQMSNDIADFEAKNPMAKTLAPELVQEMQNLPDSIPLRQRLDMALGLAATKHMDTILKVTNEMAANQATEQAYSNQELKRGQTGSAPRVANAAQPQAAGLLERAMSGQLSDSEWRENAVEIDRLMKEQTMSAGLPQ